MDRLIALEKLMMSCQDKDGLGMLKDVAQSRKEIQVSHSTRLYRQEQEKCAAPHVRSDSPAHMFFILIGAQREAEGVGKQGHSLQSAGWREDQHQRLRPEEHRCSSAEETAECSKSQQTAGCGPALTRSATTKDPFPVLQFQLASFLIKLHIMQIGLRKLKKFFAHVLYHGRVVPRSR